MSVPAPVIILTGASRGLGLAVLRILLEKYNARVTTLSRSMTDELDALSHEFGSDRVMTIQGDVANPHNNSQAVHRTMQKWGALHGLILNAGSIEPIGQ
jgi:NADP-dependent 3-hydroxy acid dehydrogenase YdfG